MTSPSASDNSVPMSAAISRRTACGIMAGAAATALQGLAPPAFASGARQGRDAIRYVITDRRYPESLEFAAAFQRMGIRRLEITDGLTNLWRTSLLPLWRDEGGAIAGLTRRETWVCLAEQARSAGRKSVLSGQHAFSANGGVSDHYLSGSRAALANASVLERCGRGWPGVVAELALRCPTGDRLVGASRRFPGPDGPEEAMPSFFLVSWVIA